MFIAVRTGLEPATPCVTGMYSNQAELPHQYVFFYSLQLLRLLPLDCECKVRLFYQVVQIFMH